MEEEVERLQGTWRFASLEVEGMPVPTAAYRTARIEIRGERFVTTAPDASYTGTFTVDADARPRTIDMDFSGGPEAGKTSLGIYELDGDTWRICLGLTGKERPTEFASRPESGHALETLERDRS